MTLCLIEGCSLPARADDGWCENHHYRWARYGDPLGGYASHSVSPEERFWWYTDRRGDNECWPFRLTSPVTKRGGGYGRLTISGQHRVPAHRFSYELHHGSIPEGLVVRHSCDNPACVNPRHLLVGTQGDNVRDAVTRGRHRSPQGEKSGKSKLTKKQARAIFLSTEKPKLAAERYGVSEANVRAIRQRLTWGWATQDLAKPTRKDDET